VATDRLRDLDHRRRWARRRAPVWFALGAVVIGLAAAGVVAVLAAGLARAWSWATGDGFRDAPVWSATGVAAAGLVTVVVVLAVGATVVHGLVGAPRRVLRDVGAAPVDRGAIAPGSPSGMLVNVVDALAIGLGVTPPELAIIDDDAPNALSVRWGRHRTIAVTTGLLGLPRPEVEAVCAHELAHLHAVDARWITAGEATLGRAKLAGLLLAAAGALVVVGSVQIGFLPSLLGFGVVIAALGATTAALLARAQRRLRAESDAVADVAAIRLARDPGSLGAACASLAADRRVVARSSWRSEHAWFVPVTELITVDHERPASGVDPVAAELHRRAAAAYAIANVPFAWTPPTTRL
jgi:Zn-dependent protease with chaperone function